MVLTAMCRLSGDQQAKPRDWLSKVSCRGGPEGGRSAIHRLVVPPPCREVWDEAAQHYDERGLAALVLWISVVNVFNRVNVATRQIPGQRLPQPAGN